MALVDHSGGSLAARLPTAWTSPGVAGLTVHDRGAHPGPAAVSLDGLADAVILVVASATPAALTLLPRALDQVFASASQRPVHLVLAQVHGRYRGSTGDLSSRVLGATSLPRDDSLAADGPIDGDLLTRRTVRDLSRSLTTRA